MPIKIVSTDGSPSTTRILDADTGQDLTGRLMVERIEIIIEPGEPNRAFLTLVNVEMEVAASPLATIKAFDLDDINHDFVRSQLALLGQPERDPEADCMAACLMVDSGYDGNRSR